MFVSALIPTRGRPDLLRRAVKSLREEAFFPEAVEVCIATDADDEESTDLAYELGADVVYTAPMRVGYGMLHHYVNALAASSTGTWLFLFNDDATVETNHWDDVLAEEKAPGVLNTRTNHPNQGDMAPFPIVHRRIYEAMGHFSRSNHNDTYVEEVGKRSTCFRPVRIKVFHDRPDLTGRPEDATHQERIYKTEEFYGPEMQGWIAEDVAKVQRALYG